MTKRSTHKPAHETLAEAAFVVFKSQKKFYTLFEHAPYYQHMACCSAIITASAIGDDYRRAVAVFKRYFKPRGKSTAAYWFGGNWRLTKEEQQARVDHRVYALLIAACLAYDEGR